MNPAPVVPRKIQCQCRFQIPSNHPHRNQEHHHLEGSQYRAYAEQVRGPLDPSQPPRAAVQLTPFHQLIYPLPSCNLSPTFSIWEQVGFQEVLGYSLNREVNSP